MKLSFVPANFNPPIFLKTPNFILRSLKTTDCQKDFEAVKNSLDYRGGEDLKVKRLSYKQNLTNLQRGTVFIVAGVLVVLDALNLLSQTVHFMFIIAGIGLIIYGLSLTNVWEKIQRK